MYVQGQFPCDGPGRPSENMNIMSHGPPLVPMMPIQCGSASRVGNNQLSADGLPKYSGGTGIYLPNPNTSQAEMKQDIKVKAHIMLSMSWQSLKEILQSLIQGSTSLTTFNKQRC